MSKIKSDLENLFNEQMCLLEHFLPARIAVAVSGGADSMCLTYLAQQWAEKWNVKLVALTVDHGLRPESEKEAKHVAKQLKSSGITHQILRWVGEKPTTRIEETAREARYQLLCDYCKQKKIPILLLAHHRQDNIETFFLRLTKATGLTGLAGIHPMKRRGDILLLRPLLNADKQDILSFLKQKNIDWVEDPMNQNPVFERVHWRQQFPILSKMGLRAEYLTRTLARLRRADNALTQITDNIIHQIQPDERGFVAIPLNMFDKLPEEIQIRILLHFIPIIGGTDKPLSLDRLETILANKPIRITFGNCYLIRHKNNLLIAKEADRMPAPTEIPAKKWIVWDRFKIFSSVPAIVQHRTNKDDKCDLPALVQHSFPILFNKKGLEIYPNLDYKTKSPHISIIIQFLPLNKG